MSSLAAQPTSEHTQQHGGVEPVGLRPSMLPRDGNTGGMDDVRFDPTCNQPTGQPEAVAAERVNDFGTAGFVI